MSKINDAIMFHNCLITYWNMNPTGIRHHAPHLHYDARSKLPDSFFLPYLNIGGGASLPHQHLGNGTKLSNGAQCIKDLATA